MLQGSRGEFSSRIGFVLAATGSAVGLGNVWGFPTNAAGNGGGAFVAIYLILAFVLAYPALMAELVIGRHTRANIYSALEGLASNAPTRLAARLTGGYAVLVASAILGFYTLVAGWVLAQLCAAIARVLGWPSMSGWFATASLGRDLASAALFAVLTVLVVSGGVRNGIERWSTRLMPALLILLLALIGYVLTQPGALAGLRLYLVPDIARILDAALLVSALGQAFFSLSLGVGTMLVYASYLDSKENLPVVGAMITGIDTLVAFLAGLLVIPAMFVAQRQGIEIHAGGELIAGPDLIFQVLPALFGSMAQWGDLVALAFFALLAIAALTSSISMLEVPVALAVEKTPLARGPASWLIGIAVFAATALIACFFDPLFGLVVTVTTEYSQPLVGIALCLFAGWAIHRDRLLAEIRASQGEAAGLFWKIWPPYVRIVCPLLIAATFLQGLIH